VHATIHFVLSSNFVSYMQLQASGFTPDLQRQFESLTTFTSTMQGDGDDDDGCKVCKNSVRSYVCCARRQFFVVFNFDPLLLAVQ
jgi:hypothetical protein